MVRDENCLAKTTVPAAAVPIARQLGTRDQNSVGGKTANQPCISREYKPCTASRWPSSRHRSGNDRLAEAELVAPSSNHSDGRLAAMLLITAASSAIASGSSSLPRRWGRESLAATAVLGSSSIEAIMMCVTVKAQW